MLKPMLDLPFQPVNWGAEPHDFTKQDGGDHNLNLGVYTNETTQRYICGTRSLTWDGRVFRYSKCGSLPIPNNKYGVKNLAILVACKDSTGENNAVTVVDTDVGATEMKVTFTLGTLGNSLSINPIGGFQGRNGILFEHELCGGYISLYTGVHRQTRGIVGNTAVAATDTSMIIYLDAPLDYELSSSKCEILANPYTCIGESPNTYSSNMGVAIVTAVVGDYIWIQTWGPLRFTNTGGDLGGTENIRQFVFIGNGAIMPNSTNSGNHALQHAGFLIETTYGVTLSGAPFLMLQISP